MDLKALIEREANKQVKALAEMEKRLDKRSVALQKELYALIRDKFLDSLSRDENGKLIYNASNLNRVNAMNTTWEYFRDSQFRPEVLSFGKDLLSIVDVEAGYFMALGKEFNIPFEFDQVRELISKQIGITLDRTPSIIPNSYLDRLLQGSQVQDKVTNIVLENVSAKASFSKLKADLSDVILGTEDVNGAMTKYLRTYAYDSFSVVQRTIDLNMADTYGMNCFVYEGNLIKDSREFCQDHLGEIICRDQFAEFDAMDWQGKNPDVPFELSLGGYNCRHNPMWIPDEAKPYLENQSLDQISNARTIEEAQQWAINNNIAKSVNYSNVTVNEANTINNHLSQLKKEYGVTLDGVITESNKGLSGIEGGMSSVRGENYLTLDADRIKKAFYNNESLFNGYNKRIEIFEDELRTAKELGWTDDVIKLENRIDGIKEQMKNSAEFWSAGDYAKTFDDRINYIIDHEYGHLIQSQRSVYESDVYRKIADYFSATADLNKYTEYAKTNWSEFWSEAYSLWKNDLLKDSDMIELLKEVEKYAKTNM